MVSERTFCIVEDVAAPTRNALVGGPFGSNLVSSDYVDSGIPVIRGQNMGDGRWVDGEFVFVSPQKAKELAANIARPGDLVFTQRGTLGQVAIVPAAPYGQYVVSQSQMKLTVDPEKVDILFLYYLFTSHEQQEHILRNAIQTGVPHTNLTILRNTPLELPPLEEQREIAHVLGSLDDKIELNRRMNATLEATARAIFQSWFVDFDPVHAKARGEQPLGMDAEIAALFPDSFEESELGMIPAGWQVGELAEIASIIMGQSPPGDTYNESGDGIPLVNGPVEFGEYFLVKRKWTTSPTKLSRDNDLIFCVRGSTTGKTILADDTFCLGRGVCAIRSHSDCQEFVNQSIWVNLARLLAKTTGSVFPNLSSEDINRFKILIPSFELMNAFDQVAVIFREKIAANINQNVSLTETRDVLLPKLISGEVPNYR